MVEARLGTNMDLSNSTKAWKVRGRQTRLIGFPSILPLWTQLLVQYALPVCLVKLADWDIADWLPSQSSGRIQDKMTERR
jgi:hypothetical protein